MVTPSVLQLCIPVQTQTVPPTVTITTIDNMDGATFTTIIPNASPPLGRTATLMTNLHGQYLLIVDHVTNYQAIDDVVDKFYIKVCSDHH